MVQHLCNGSDQWEDGIRCHHCPLPKNKATKLGAPNFNTARLKAWNNYQGAGGMTGREYVNQMMEDNRRAGKTPEQMPVPATRWI